MKKAAAAAAAVRDERERIKTNMPMISAASKQGVVCILYVKEQS